MGEQTSRAGSAATAEGTMDDMTVYRWALDLDADDWPWRSHPIVTIEGETPNRRYITACGRRYFEGGRGCWSTSANENPLPTLACPDCEVVNG